MLKELPQKEIMKLIYEYLFNARLQYFLKHWKIAKVITIPKADKPLNEITSYRPISLLPIISKIVEKLIIKRLKFIGENKFIPEHQFDFRDKYSTIDQVHIRITDLIETALENKNICSAMLLDIPGVR